jgi:PEP-CTERM motif
VFLEGVNTPPIPTPEPATLTLLGVGVLGVAGMVRRRRGKRNVAG